MNLEKRDKIIILIVISAFALFSYMYKFKLEKDMLLKQTEMVEQISYPVIEENTQEKGKVHITGEISKKGVYDINSGDRLVDLVEKAGGLTAQADENKINLAMKLEDQMKIVIPKKGENSQETEVYDNQDGHDKVNINSADENTLMTLPNIGEKRAKAIIEYREKTPFKKIEDIKNVSGIGDKFYESLKDYITVN